MFGCSRNLLHPMDLWLPLFFASFFIHHTMTERLPPRSRRGLPGLLQRSQRNAEPRVFRLSCLQVHKAQPSTRTRRPSSLTRNASPPSTPMPTTSAAPPAVLCTAVRLQERRCLARTHWPRVPTDYQRGSRRSRSSQASHLA